MDRTFPTRRAALSTAAFLLAALPARKSRADPAPLLGDLGKFARVSPPVVVPGTVAWREFPGDGSGNGVRRTVADERGHAVLLNVWATWCGPCVAEMPALAALASRAAASGIVVRPVSIDLTGVAAVRMFYQRAKVTGLPIVVDEDGSVRRNFGVAAVPVTFLIGPDGALRARLDAAADWTRPDVLDRLHALLG